MGGDQNTELKGPDLTVGVTLTELVEGEPFVGHAHGENIVLIRTGENIHAVSATCTHYGGPLDEGIVAGGEIRCPWHHAAFNIETGFGRGPGLEPISCYRVTKQGKAVVVGDKIEHEVEEVSDGLPDPVVILGAGAAGAACAEELRRRGYKGAVTLVGNKEPFPVDRPNLSKDFLAGNAPAEWLPVRTEEYYDEHDITFVKNPAIEIDTADKTVTLEDGDVLSYGALVMAMGAEARRLDIEGADHDHVYTLHELHDSKAILEDVLEGDTAVIIGAGFIGLEAAASLREQGMEVHVVAPEEVPLARIVGEEVGAVLQKVHEDNGVTFHLGHTPASIGEESVTLDDGTELPAHLVIMGVGVRPRAQLAEAAGIEVDNGVVVDEFLRTSAADVYAVGDLALYPDGQGRRVRIEHWAVAERQGQSVAKVLAGQGRAYKDVPFFWSHHVDTGLAYVGHAEDWDEILIDGDLEGSDATVVYKKDGRIDAVVTMGRDDVSLRAEYFMEIDDQEQLAKLVSA